MATGETQWTGGDLDRPELELCLCHCMTLRHLSSCVASNFLLLSQGTDLGQSGQERSLKKIWSFVPCPRSPRDLWPSGALFHLWPAPSTSARLSLGPSQTGVGHCVSVVDVGFSDPLKAAALG